MSPRPTRRAVTSGAAWAVPVVAVGAAAPALAASTVPCPTSATRVSVSATGSGSNKTWTVQIRFTGLVVGQTYVGSVQVTDSKGTGGSPSISFTATATTETRTYVATRHDNGSTTSITSITYSIQAVPGGTVCTGSI